MILDLSTPDTRAFAKQIDTDSLGDHSYIVVVGDQAAAIDIQRDLDRFDAVLRGIDATLVAVFETHIHNDYVSGGKRLAEDHGATYVLPANTGAPYPHHPLADGQAVPVGDWVLRAMHTPGHTYNHTSYILESDEGPVAIFSGGSMLVGAVGRSDLLGPDHTAELLAHQFASAHRIARMLPDPSVVAPTHGSGSFCSASDVADTTSTIEREKMQNPALLASSAEVFAETQIMGYRRYPAYYRHMAPANLEPVGAPPAESLPVIVDADQVGDATVIDVRPFEEYASGHLPGSLSIPMSTDDAVYMGWTLPWNSPVVLVGRSSTVDEVRVHMQRIGWDAVVGRIEPATIDLMADGDLATMGVSTFADMSNTGDATLIDVRDPVEHREGIISGAVPVHLADIAADVERYAAPRVVVHCQGGYRAAIAGSFLERAGSEVTVVFDDLGNYRGELVAPAG